MIVALEKYEQNGRLILSYSNEAVFLRALLPMVSMARQSILPTDMVCHILAQLIPQQSKLPDKQLVSEKAFRFLNKPQSKGLTNLNSESETQQSGSGHEQNSFHFRFFNELCTPKKNPEQNNQSKENPEQNNQAMELDLTG